MLLALYLCQRSNFLTKYIYIAAFQICSCCTSSGRAMLHATGNGKVSDYTRRNSETNIINREGQNFDLKKMSEKMASK
jgi:hypothetical protein